MAVVTVRLALDLASDRESEQVWILGRASIRICLRSLVCISISDCGRNTDGIREAVSPCLLKDLASNRMGWETIVGMVVHVVSPCLKSSV